MDVSDSEREAYRRMLSRRPPDRQAGTPLDVVIGLDFGTSGTKVVMRAPFAAGDQTWALPVPGWARDGHPDVWASRMWLDARGVISLVPMHGAVPVCGIKNAIMRGRTDAGDSWTCGPVTLTPPEATTAFLALMLRAARSFFSREVASGMRGGPLRWQVNAGLPAARCEPGPMLSAYRRALAAAFVLSDRCEETTDLRELRGALTDPDVLACAEQMAHPGQTPLAIIPEVAAEVAGLARANSLMPGLNVLVDVGCGTLDICSFRRNEDAEGGLNWPILLASVRLLGSGALAACANEADRRGLAVSVRTQAMEIIHGTRRRRDRNAACWQADKRLPVLLAGGGAASDLHLGVVRSLDDWLRQHVHNGGTRLILVGEPSGLKARCAAHEAHRLSVAWGLSLPASDIGRIVQPNEIEDMSEPTRREQDDRDSTR